MKKSRKSGFHFCSEQRIYILHGCWLKTGEHGQSSIFINQTSNGITLDTFKKYFVEIQSPPSEANSSFDMQYPSYVEEFMNNIYDCSFSSNHYMTDLPISIQFEVQKELTAETITLERDKKW